MDDLNAFERQLTNEVQRAFVSVRPVEVASIVRTAATGSPRWSFRSMFGATRFVVAGVIVALFGGFLLAGVLTTPQSDDPRPAAGASMSAEPEQPNQATNAPDAELGTDLLPGVDLVTEEIEPGVFRVLSDGIHPLANKNLEEYGFLHASIEAGADGSVWLFFAETFFRIGDEQTHGWRGSNIGWTHYGGGAYRRDDIEVGPDGTLWWAGAHGERGLRSFDGETWAERLDAPFWGAVREVEIDPAGTVWATSEDYSTNEMSVGRLGTDGWESLVTLDRGWTEKEHGRPRLSVSGSGEVLMFEGNTSERLWRLAENEGAQWERIPIPDIQNFHLSSDGTIWAWRDELVTGGLRRFDGADWTDLELPSHAWEEEYEQNYYDWAPVLMEAAADGSVWLAHWWGNLGSECDGVTKFDGSQATTFLAGICVSDMDEASDGSLWLIESGRGAASGEVYVITPEAVSAAMEEEMS